MATLEPSTAILKAPALAKPVIVTAPCCGDVTTENVRASPSRSLAWMAWTARMVLVHLPSRLFVAPGDLPNHDFHHRLPKGDWANSAYARRDDGLANTETGRWPDYTERWGFAAAVGETFGLLASLPADAVLGDPLTYRERAEAMLGM